MNQEFIEKLRGHINKYDMNYHLVVMAPFGESSRYLGERHSLDYIFKITEEVLKESYFINPQSMFKLIADSLRVSPSALIIPQGHADADAILNLENHFGTTLPNIPIFHAMKNTGDYCNEDGSLKDSAMKKEKDKLVEFAYRNWLLTSVKPNPL